MLRKCVFSSVLMIRGAIVMLQEECVSIYVRLTGKEMILQAKEYVCLHVLIFLIVMSISISEYVSICVM